jgi:hypothetical protein
MKTDDPAFFAYFRKFVAALKEKDIAKPKGLAGDVIFAHDFNDDKLRNRFRGIDDFVGLSSEVITKISKLKPEDFEMIDKGAWLRTTGFIPRGARLYRAFIASPGGLELGMTLFSSRRDMKYAGYAAVERDGG